LASGETKAAGRGFGPQVDPPGYEIGGFDTSTLQDRVANLITKECAGCHGWEHIPFHKMGLDQKINGEAAVNRMFEVNRMKVPIVSPEAVSPSKGNS